MRPTPANVVHIVVSIAAGPASTPIDAKNNVAKGLAKEAKYNNNNNKKAMNRNPKAKGVDHVPIVAHHVHVDLHVVEMPEADSVDPATDEQLTVEAVAKEALKTKAETTTPNNNKAIMEEVVVANKKAANAVADPHEAQEDHHETTNVVDHAQTNSHKMAQPLKINNNNKEEEQATTKIKKINNNHLL